MEILVKGLIFPIIMLIIFIILEVYFGGKKEAMELRRIEGVEKIDEALGRATEMGQPVLSSTGFDPLNSTEAPAILANLDIIGYLARETAKLGTQLILGIGPSDVLPLAQEIYRENSILAGYPEAYNEDNVRYLTKSIWAYTASMMRIMEEERPAANIFIGRYHAEALHLGMIGRRTGAMTIGGSTSLSMAAFFVVTSDYTLFGDEIYAAGAYLSKDPLRINTISGRDVMKWICVALLLIGTITITMGSDTIANLLINW